MSESETEEVEADSVIQNMKDRRKASGQEIADIKLRTKLYGSGAIKDATSKKPFMDQFPYKSCQRGYQPTRKKHMSLPDRRSKDDDPGAMLKKVNIFQPFVILITLTTWLRDLFHPGTSSTPNIFHPGSFPPRNFATMGHFPPRDIFHPRYCNGKCLGGKSLGWIRSKSSGWKRSQGGRSSGWKMSQGGKSARWKRSRGGKGPGCKMFGVELVPGWKRSFNRRDQ